MSNSHRRFKTHIFSVNQTDFSLHSNLVTCVIFGKKDIIHVSDESRHLTGRVICIKQDTPHRVVIGPGGADVLYFDGIQISETADRFSILGSSLLGLPSAFRNGNYQLLKDFRYSLGKDHYSNSEQMITILEELYTNPSQKISQEKLAETLGLERTLALRFFKSVTGQTFRKFKKWTTIIAAAHSIYSGRPISLAALDSGFADPAHATRTSNEVFGMTPSRAASCLSSVVTL